MPHMPTSVPRRGIGFQSCLTDTIASPPVVSAKNRAEPEIVADSRLVLPCPQAQLGYGWKTQQNGKPLTGLAPWEVCQRLAYQNDLLFLDSQLAPSPPSPPQEEEWLPLGVFAML